MDTAHVKLISNINMTSLRQPILQDAKVPKTSIFDCVLATFHSPRHVLVGALLIVAIIFLLWNKDTASQNRNSYNAAKELLMLRNLDKTGLLSIQDKINNTPENEWLQRSGMKRFIQRLLRNYPQISLHKRKIVFIVSYFRSGSSFLSDIIQSKPRTFHQYEPFGMLTVDSKFSNSSFVEKQGDRLLDLWSHCNFEATPDYVRWALKKENQNFKRNHFLWSHCNLRRSLCYAAPYVSSICRRAPLHAFKVNRVDLATLKWWIAGHKHLNISVIYLVRDPRAIMNSRRPLPWCERECQDVNTLCAEMKRDIDSWEETQKTSDASTYIKIKFEDLSASPRKVTTALMKQLEISTSREVDKFIDSHTVSASWNDNQDPYSTRRNSTQVITSWMRNSTIEKIRHIEKVCSTVMSKLGYTVYTP